VGIGERQAAGEHRQGKGGYADEGSVLAIHDEAPEWLRRTAEFVTEASPSRVKAAMGRNPQAGVGAGPIAGRVGVALGFALPFAAGSALLHAFAAGEALLHPFAAGEALLHPFAAGEALLHPFTAGEAL
jgi:hypothetical protein